jgi:glutamine amidotransferase
MRVVLADYGAGNLRSVSSAFARAGAEVVISADEEEVREAPLAVIAGVGHAGSALLGLQRQNLDWALLDRVHADRPTLAICVGMQLLFDHSEEIADAGGGRKENCLGFFKGSVERLVARRVPHMGWNTLRVEGDIPVLDGLDGEDVYFAHSYAARPSEPLPCAEVDHDGPVVAAVQRGALAGVQFHPERSGPVGARLLENVMAWSRSA